jgi:hypothetical protein
MTDHPHTSLIDPPISPSIPASFVGVRFLKHHPERPKRQGEKKGNRKGVSGTIQYPSHTYQRAIFKLLRHTHGPGGGSIRAQRGLRVCPIIDRSPFDSFTTSRNNDEEVK